MIHIAYYFVNKENKPREGFKHKKIQWFRKKKKKILMVVALELEARLLDQREMRNLGFCLVTYLMH